MCIKVPKESIKRALESLELELQMMWATWEGCWENDTDILEEQQKHAHEPSLQPLFNFIRKFAGLSNLSLFISAYPTSNR